MRSASSCRLRGADVARQHVDGEPVEREVEAARDVDAVVRHRHARPRRRARARRRGRRASARSSRVRRRRTPRARPSAASPPSTASRPGRGGRRAGRRRRSGAAARPGPRRSPQRRGARVGELQLGVAHRLDQHGVARGEVVEDVVRASSPRAPRSPRAARPRPGGPDHRERRRDDHQAAGVGARAARRPGRHVRARSYVLDTRTRSLLGFEFNSNPLECHLATTAPSPSSPPGCCSPRPRPRPPPSRPTACSATARSTRSTPRPVREAIAIRDGEIVYVGSDRGARRYIGRRTKVTDLRGRMVMPGLHDGHIHGITEAADACSLNYEPLTVARVHRAHPGVPRRDGRTRSPTAGCRCPRGTSSSSCPAGTVVTKEVLDGLRTQRPIVVASSDGHTSLVNSRGAGAGGHHGRDAGPVGRAHRARRGRAAQRPAAGRRAAPRRARCCRRPPATRSTRRGAACALRARGHHVVLRARLRRRRRRSARSTRLRQAGGLTARAHFAIGPFSNSGDTVASLAAHRRPAAQALRDRACRAPCAPGGPAASAGRGSSPGRASRSTASSSCLDGVVQAPAQTAALLEPYLVDGHAGSEPRRALPRQPAARPAAARLRAARLPVARARDRRPRRARDARRRRRRCARRTGCATRGRRSPTPSSWRSPTCRRFADLRVQPVMSYQWAKPAPDSTDTVVPFLGPGADRAVRARGAAAGGRRADRVRQRLSRRRARRVLRGRGRGPARGRLGPGVPAVRRALQRATPA